MAQTGVAGACGVRSGARAVVRVVRFSGHEHTRTDTHRHTHAPARARTYGEREVRKQGPRSKSRVHTTRLRLRHQCASCAALRTRRARIVPEASSDHGTARTAPDNTSPLGYAHGRWPARELRRRDTARSPAIYRTPTSVLEDLRRACRGPVARDKASRVVLSHPNQHRTWVSS